MESEPQAGLPANFAAFERGHGTMHVVVVETLAEGRRRSPVSWA